jgi:hypothetical protein
VVIPHPVLNRRAGPLGIYVAKERTKSEQIVATPP